MGNCCPELPSIPGYFDMQRELYKEDVRIYKNSFINNHLYCKVCGYGEVELSRAISIAKLYGGIIDGELHSPYMRSSWSFKVKFLIQDPEDS